MKHPWMPFYVQDFQMDTLDLEVDEIGVYVVLLCLAWQRDGSLPADEEWLRKVLKRSFATFHGHTYNRIVPKLLARYFVLADGVYTNKRLTKEKQKAHKLSANQKQKADKRWAETRENNKLADAAAMPSTTTITTTITKKEKETREDALSLSNQFDDFWKVWPNKVGKPAAVKAFAAAIKRGAPPGDILAGVWNYIRDKPPDRSWLNPATFLNQNRWEDQPAAVGATNGKIGNISSACDNLVELVNRGFGGAPPQDSFGSGADQADVKLLSYRRG